MRAAHPLACARNRRLQHDAATGRVRALGPALNARSRLHAPGPLATGSYRWTHDDIRGELQRKKAQRVGTINPAAEKAHLKRQLDIAMLNGNIDEANR